MTEETDRSPLGEESSVVFFKNASKARKHEVDYFQRLMDSLPVAIYTTDAAGLVTYYNDAAAALWGARPKLGETKFCGSWKLYRSDGTPISHAECPMAISLRENRSVRDIEVIIERPDGSRVRCLPFPTPLRDASGELRGAINLIVDVSDRYRAELYAQQLACIVESSHDAIVSKDLDGVIKSWNRGAEVLFGYKSDEAIGRSVTILIPWDRLDEETTILDRVRAGVRVETYETVRRRKDGTRVDVSLTVSPVRDMDGRIVGASKIARDISHRKQAEEQQRLIVGEMRHRIKNSLATVQAIASQTLRSTSAEERKAFIGRLHALSRAHDLLNVEVWDGTALSEIVAMALQAFEDTHRQRFIVDGPRDLRLEANKAVLLVMTLHELATNAVKYGALSNHDGTVEISWSVVPDSQSSARFKMCWQERGGPPVRTPERQGFGSQLLVRAFQGGDALRRMEFNPEGFVCELEMTGARV
ncbi:MAG: sensor histidine kinase [Dongiaceae bacterium]